MELQRIKFMVNSYLRIRLEKIQKNIFYYANQHEDNPGRLTSKEYEFARDFHQNLREHFETLALRHVPGDWQSDKAITKPSLGSAVFVSVKEEVGEVEVDAEGERADLSRDSQYMLQYSAVSHLLQEDRVKLL